MDCDSSTSILGIQWIFLVSGSGYLFEDLPIFPASAWMIALLSKTFFFLQKLLYPELVRWCWRYTWNGITHEIWTLVAVNCSIVDKGISNEVRQFYCRPAAFSHVASLNCSWRIIQSGFWDTCVQVARIYLDSFIPPFSPLRAPQSDSQCPNEITIH